MKAMILAAGKGERMRPLTDHLPKPLLSVGGSPLIVHHLRKLKAAGVTDIVINHAWLGEKLEQYLGDGSDFGVDIQWSPEREGGLETAGGIRHALHLLGDSPFLVMNGDVWLDTDYRQFTEQTLRDDQLAHLWLVDNPPQHPNGDFSIVQGDVVDVPEYTFSGVGLYRPQAFQHLEEGFTKLAPLLREWMADRLVSGSHLQADWRDIGTPERLHQLDQVLQERGLHAG